MLIVDGYNWLFDAVAAGVADDGPLERLRARAIRLLLGWIDWRGEAVLIVFDGVGRRSREIVEGVEIWFTDAHREADDDIVSRVRASDRPREIRVVTADRGLGRRVAELGAEVWSPQDFSQRLADLRRQGTRKLTAGDAEKPVAEPDVDGMVRAFEDAPPLEQAPPVEGESPTA